MSTGGQQRARVRRWTPTINVRLWTPTNSSPGGQNWVLGPLSEVQGAPREPREGPQGDPGDPKGEPTKGLFRNAARQTGPESPELIHNANE